MKWEEAFPFYLWSIWLTRNDNHHNNTKKRINLQSTYFHAIEFLSLTNSKRDRAKPKLSFVKWRPPTIGYKLNTN
ncbi:hypothetical protein R3W88_033344 [Solanum pinnatisectum]|uniref:Uncharacterized protein n=1 Tax=Solanum pinnatisectum TaxID=50273 RepID=A0AAV9K1F0_9SOLN|nr:hypothetical protein R3W88_033344 [Solanum pinnatisectum]